MSIQERAERLQQLHQSPTILRVVNVWDPITAEVVAGLPETTALATAGHSIAASHGYADGEIPVDEMIAAVARIVAATDLPVSADLDDGYADPAETTRKAIGAGAVGANVEDRLLPLAESVARVEAIVQAAEAEGVAFQLNARTDAFVRGGDRPLEVILDDAIARGTAYLEAGASLVFVPGPIDRAAAEKLVGAFGPGRLSVIGIPGALTAAEYEELGVARISYGPWTQNAALTALKRLAVSLYDGGVLPEDTEKLN
jgi:2-methylisocitrate lyase-like PEP mutase family enzyme